MCPLNCVGHIRSKQWCRKNRTTVKACNMHGFFRTSRLLLFAALVFASSVSAAFDPVTAYREVDAVAIRYPEPHASYATPAFAVGKVDFTSQSEMMAYLRQLAGRAPSMRL